MTAVPALETLLVANRGEIARRVFRTARRLGLRTVAVYAPDDRGAPFVTDADMAVGLPGYLDIAAVVAAARRSGATAVHPGYGFLAEDPTFARACEEAGLTFVGPPAHAMEAMARKVEAKDLARKVGVPVLDSVEVAVADDTAAALDGAAGIGYPLLVKPSAGGGGKGMRRVTHPGELAEALRGARAEALAAFGDATLLCERELSGARHVEVQVLADIHGDVLTLGERDCSVQRRHQKLVEEAPAPGLSAALRARLAAAATSLARAVGYVNAGTVEFLVAGEECFFLEMNTRLQVEHPVTEEVTGLDLVELQLAVAAGGRVPAAGSVQVRGHAVEARVYAERPAAGFLPSPGTVRHYRPPGGEGIRVEDGVAPGVEMGLHYDPLLLKVIAHGATREAAITRLRGALRTLRLHGPVTNRDYLLAVLGDPDFRAGGVGTDFVGRHPELLSATPDPALVAFHAVAAALWRLLRAHHDAPVLSFTPPAWRNVRAVPQRVRFLAYEDAVEVEAAPERDGTWRVRCGGHSGSATVVAHGAEAITLEFDGLLRRCEVAVADGTLHVDSADAHVAFAPLPEEPAEGPVAAGTALVAPLPARVVTVAVAPGAQVAAGDTLVVLEAMKMEHRLDAPRDGVVEQVRVEAGDTVEAHQVVVTLREQVAGDA